MIQNYFTPLSSRGQFCYSDRHNRLHYRNISHFSYLVDHFANLITYARFLLLKLNLSIQLEFQYSGDGLGRW
jgi:hypothetical protein